LSNKQKSGRRFLRTINNEKDDDVSASGGVAWRGVDRSGRRKGVHGGGGMGVDMSGRRKHRRKRRMMRGMWSGDVVGEEEGGDEEDDAGRRKGGTKRMVPGK